MKITSKSQLILTTFTIEDKNGNEYVVFHDPEPPLDQPVFTVNDEDDNEIDGELREQLIKLVIPKLK